MTPLPTLEEQIRQAANEQGDTSQARPITVDLGDGTPLTFNTAEELSANLRQALSQVGGEVTNLKAQLAEALEARGSYAADDTPVETDKFNMERFVGLMKTNPVDAFEYVDGFRYGTEKPAQFIKQSLAEANEIRQEHEVNRFLQAHPEFPGGQAGVVLNKVREQLGQPMTKNGLEVAYSQAIQNNVIPDFKTNYALAVQQQQFAKYLQDNGIDLPAQTGNQTQNQYQQPYQQFNAQPQNYGRPQGIPTIPRAQPVTQNEQAMLGQFENLSLEQMESVLKKNGLFGQF